MTQENVASASSQQHETSLSPEVFAVVAAAVAIATGRKGRIKRIRYRRGPTDVDTTWAKLGRYAIMTSHQPRR
jgi:hypothetical protein